jgi:hypothetical protein
VVVVLGTGLLTAATSGRESPGSDDRDRQVPSQVPNAQESETPGENDEIYARLGGKA